MLVSVFSLTFHHSTEWCSHHRARLSFFVLQLQRIIISTVSWLKRLLSDSKHWLSPWERSNLNTLLHICSLHYDHRSVVLFFSSMYVCSLLFFSSLSSFVTRFFHHFKKFLITVKCFQISSNSSVNHLTFSSLLCISHLFFSNLFIPDINLILHYITLIISDVILIINDINLMIQDINIIKHDVNLIIYDIKLVFCGFPKLMLLSIYN